MNKLRLGVIFFVLILGIQMTAPEWGFFGHRKINRLAVFTLDEDLFPFYRFHIEFLTEHAVDPDKRRYATKHEAVRHYIDVDHWGETPFETVPREYAHAFLKHASFYSIDSNLDTTELSFNLYDELDFIKSEDAYKLKEIFYEKIDRERYEDEIVIDCNDMQTFLDVPQACSKILIEDNFSAYGILPYFLPRYYSKLVKAFKEKNAKRVLQLSADIGHYIGDAHVPLHTTENYNGQLTNQVGIHAFWESRLPELFADEQYDFFVGKAEYIPDMSAYIWKVIEDSHDLLDEVLDFEKELSNTLPSDQQFCFENRLEKTIKTQCEAYCIAYHDKLDGMVEKRMQDAIQSIGSVWLSAWIDAGQPDVRKILEVDWNKIDEEAQKELEALFRNSDIKGRRHDN